MFINTNKNIIYKIRNYAKHSILKKFETGTERSTKNKPTHLSGFLFIFDFYLKNDICFHTLFFAFFTATINCIFVFQKRLEESLFYYASNYDS